MASADKEGKMGSASRPSSYFSRQLSKYVIRRSLYAEHGMV